MGRVIKKNPLFYSDAGRVPTTGKSLLQTMYD